jgi:integrase/recombinase XerD
MNRFLRHHPAFHAADLTNELLRAYVFDYADTAPVSAMLARCALVHFGSFVWDKGYSDFNIAAGIPKPRPKLQKPRRDEVPPDIVPLFLPLCDKLDTTEYLKKHARAVMVFLIYGGLRRAEVAALKLDDVNTETGHVIIQAGKGNKRREIYLHADDCAILKDFLTWRRRFGGTQFLQRSANCEMSEQRGCGNIIAALCRVGGIVAKLPNGKNGYYTAHQFRHSIATRLLANGASLPDVQAFLGHSNVRTTSLYLHTNDHKQRRLVEFGRINPPENHETLPLQNQRPIMTMRRESREQEKPQRRLRRAVR